MKANLVKLVVWAALALALAGCAVARGEGPAATPTEEPGVSIKGNVSEVRAGSGDETLGIIRVEGEKIEGNTYGRADLRIRPETRILARQGEALVPVEFDALAVGQLVEAKMTGPIAESWPVQAAASEVVILAQAPRN